MPPTGEASQALLVLSTGPPAGANQKFRPRTETGQTEIIRLIGYGHRVLRKPGPCSGEKMPSVCSWGWLPTALQLPPLPRGPPRGQLRHEAFTPQHTEAAERRQSRPWVNITAGPYRSPQNSKRGQECEVQRTATHQTINTKSLSPAFR